MKKYIFIILWFSLVNIFQVASQNLYSELYDQSEGINVGYGAWGEYNYIRQESVDVIDKGTITFYHPDVEMSQRPTVFFISGWGNSYAYYDKYCKFIASHGYAVIHIYNLSPGSIVTSYQNSLDMMQEAVSEYGGWIDTSKVGLAGHSYGSGSTIWLGKTVFSSEGFNWGTDGRFIVMLNPWYSFLMEDEDLLNYPEGVKLLTIVGHEDMNTDPRAIRAMFQLINIPNEDKDFVMLFSDDDILHQYQYDGNSYAYIADHYCSYTELLDGYNNPYDALDVYSSNRLTHAMLELVFEGNVDAANVALGNGSEEQINMGEMPDLASTDYYITTRPESDFEYQCSDNDPAGWGDPAIWKLHNYCSDDNNDGVVDALPIDINNVAMQEKIEISAIDVFPNPTHSMLSILLNNGFDSLNSYEVYDQRGVLVLQNNRPSNSNIDVSKLEIGCYFIKIKSDFSSKILPFVVY